MTKSTSVFLDGIRVLAALLVFATHIVKILYANPFWMPGHAMVIVFFVLSGYVIAFSTLDKKELIAKKYIIARLSRLSSVVVPALLLTALLLICGRTINPAYYNTVLQDHELIRFLATGLFLQSVWWRNLVPPDNGPFWSLGYEFWYYALFGVVIFVKNWRWKAILILLGCLIVGENVLLLFPIWLLGVSLYIYKDSLAISRRTATFGFAIMLIVMILFVFFLPEYPGKVGVEPLFYAASYLTDWILGLALGAVIWFYTRAFDMFSYAENFARAVQWSANHTFSLYLYHYPFILFFDAAGIFNPHIWWQAVLEIGLILASIIALSEVTESKRGLWKKALEYLWEWFEPRATTFAEDKKPSSKNLLTEN